MLCFFAFCSTTAYGVKAYDGVMEVRQPDGSMVSIRMHGDEYFGYSTLADGSVVAQGADGFYYYASYSMSGLSVSSARVGKGAFFGGLGGGRGVSAYVYSALRAKNVAARAAVDMAGGSGVAARAAYGGGGAGAASRGKFEKALVLLVEFQDLKFKTRSPETAFTNMLNQEGYAVNGATGSARDFYRDNSGGAFVPQIDVFPRVTVPQDMAFYGSNIGTNDANPRQMVVDACTAAAKAGLNLSQYDTDGDGVVDNVFIFYAGGNEAEGGGANTIWPHRWSVGGLTGSVIGGVRVNDYACSSEMRGVAGSTTMAGIGTFCHEFGHVLGLMDLYDTDGAAGGNSAGLGVFATMDAGNYLNGGNTPPYYTVIERELLGWLQPTMITTKGEVTIRPVQNNVGYRFDTQNPGEYFLFESRTNDGWDKFLPGTGMMVYHIDKSRNRVGTSTAAQCWKDNTINNITTHQCADLIEASGDEDRSKGMERFPFPGSLGITSIGALTSPALKTWAGSGADLEITGIQQSANGNVTFFAAFEPTGAAFGTISNASNIAVGGATVIFKREYVAGESGGDPQYSAIANSKGEYRVDNVAVGKYTMIVSAVGYATSSAVYDIKVGPNMLHCRLESGSSAVEVMAYEHDIKIDFRRLPGAADVRAVSWCEVGASSYVRHNVVGDDKLFYVSGVRSKTAYEIRLERADGSVIHTMYAVTQGRAMDFAAIAQGKDRYVAGDVFDMVLVGVPDGVSDVKWYVNNSQVDVSGGKCYMILSSGCRVKVMYTLGDGSVETLVKQVVLK